MLWKRSEEGDLSKGFIVLLFQMETAVQELELKCKLSEVSATSLSFEQYTMQSQLKKGFGEISHQAQVTIDEVKGWEGNTL